MLYKLLLIEGGGILGVKFLVGLLKLSIEYEKRNIDFLNLFDVFSGVSSGAIIASGLALREKILANIVKTDDKLITNILNECGYDKNQYKTIKNKLLNQKMPCSTIIIRFLINLFRNRINDIFVVNKNRVKITDSKYTDDKYKILKNYINYDLKDLPKNRYLIIKTFNLLEMNINVFSNFGDDNNGNKYSTNIAEMVHWSSNAPTYFPNNGVQIDGGNFISSVYYSEKKLFKENDLIILSIGSRISKLNLPIEDQNYKWINNVVNIAYNIGKQIDKMTNDKYYHLGFDFKKYQLDDCHLIEEIIQAANEININNALDFIENNFNNINDTKNRK